jgi:hypothetical protein
MLAAANRLNRVVACDDIRKLELCDEPRMA